MTSTPIRLRSGRLPAPRLRLRNPKCVLALLLAAPWPHLVHAATVVVTSTASDRGTFTELQCLPPGSDVDAGPGSTTVTGGATLAAAMADGVVTLREAICVANNIPEPVVIVLAPATYTLSTADNYWYGPNGLPPIGNDITIEGNGAVIERNPDNNDGFQAQRFRFFFVSRKTLTDGIAVVGGADRARLRLLDLTLRNGLARGGAGQAGGGGGGFGGAIFNQGRLDIERVSFVGNSARGGDSGTGSNIQTGRGGGIGSDASDSGGFGPGLHGGAFGGTALSDESTQIFKYACGGGAGFGDAAGGDARVRTWQLGTGVFAGDGGGLGNVGGSNPAACSDASETDCFVTGRDGGSGGAGLANTTSGNGRGGNFGRIGNTASDCGGGGGVGGGGGESGLASGVQGGAGGFGGGGGAGFDPENNQAGVTGRGGFGAGEGGLAFGIASGGGGAGLGGALFNHGGEVTAVNTTWNDNRAIGGSVTEQNLARPGAGYGGAIFNLDGILDVSYSTLAGNRVVRGSALQPTTPVVAGGAVYHRVQNPAVYGFVSRLTIHASILANSVDGSDAPVSDCNHSAHPDAAPGSSRIFSSNLFETLATVSDSEIHAACEQGSGSLVAAPRVLALADNGGSTPTMALQPDSPAIDAAGVCLQPTTDQRGVSRPQGTACDIGAFEREVLQCPAGGVLFVNRQAATGGDGGSWTRAFSDLQDALTVFDSCEIWVAAGVYKPTAEPDARSASFVLRNGVSLYGGFAGTETARDQRDPHTHLSVLSGDIDGNDNIDASGVVSNVANILGDNSYNVVVAENTDATAILDGFTITAGLANGGSARDTQGGGMYLADGSPTLRQLRFIANRATSFGGGMYSDNSSPSLDRVLFVSNWSDSLGGGLYNLSGSPVLTNVEFRGNRATLGGGMNNEFASPVLTNTSFSGNLAANGDGGGIRNVRGSPTLSNVSFSGNRAAGSGGGMFSSGVTNSPTNPLLRNAIFWNNRAISGTGTATASISSTSGGSPSFAYSLVQGCNPSGTWTANCGADAGNNLADANPQFVSTPDPAATPSLAGDLRLRARSPAVDAGDSSLNDTTLDLAGNARVFGGTIDLGAYETPYLGVELSTAGSGSGTAAIQAPLPARFDAGDNVTVVAVAAADSDFVGWSGDVSASANPLSFPIQGDTTLIANFSLQSFLVTASVSGEGSITPANQAVDFGNSASFMVAAAPGWSLDAVSGDTCSPADQGAGQWIAADIRQACAVVASFTAVATDLQVAKDAGVDTALDGQLLVYAITVANAGPLAVSGAQLADTLPANLVDAEWACLPAASNSPCPPAPFDAGSGDLYAEIDLPVDGFLRYDLSARVQGTGGTQVSNTATITPPAGVDDFDASNNSATDTVQIVPEGLFANGFEAASGALTVPAAASAQREASGR